STPFSFYEKRFNLKRSKKTLRAGLKDLHNVLNLVPFNPPDLSNDAWSTTYDVNYKIKWASKSRGKENFYKLRADMLKYHDEMLSLNLGGSVYNPPNSMDNEEENENQQVSST
ncbi:unnamed protein product, partial [Oikopleura dioica]